jgi:uncharacterized protein YjbI with pentapeptide repeats
LAGANLNGAIVTAGNLDEAIFAEQIRLTSGERQGEVTLVATLNGTSLSRASFDQTCLAGVLLTGANLNWTDLSRAALDGNSEFALDGCQQVTRLARLAGARCNTQTVLPAIGDSGGYACLFTNAGGQRMPCTLPNLADSAQEQTSCVVTLVRR